MAGKRQGMQLRLHRDIKDSVDRMYKARLLLREDKGVEGKYSMNDFFNDMVFDFVNSEEGIGLLRIYSERIYEKDKEAMIEVARKRKEEAGEEEDWFDA